MVIINLSGTYLQLSSSNTFPYTNIQVHGTNAQQSITAVSLHLLILKNQMELFTKSLLHFYNFLKRLPS